MAKIVSIYEPIHTFQEEAHAQAAEIQYYINENECHICVSHDLDKDNYPRLQRNGKHLRMSRYVYTKTTGEKIPDGMLVMHNCDEPQCVNPDHLSLGTHMDNMRDRQEKGRTVKGSDHPSSKLTEQRAYFVRFESCELSTKELAEMFRVSADTIRDIKNNKSWKHITIDMVHLSQSAA